MKLKAIVICSLTISFAVAVLMFRPFEADAGNSTLPIPSATPIRKSPAKKTALKVSNSKRTRKSDFFGNTDPSHSYKSVKNQAPQTGTSALGKPKGVVKKGQDIEVENDETHWVGHDRKPKIVRTNNRSTKRRNTRTETVNNNETLSKQRKKN